jgi:hypothetical protein
MSATTLNVIIGAIAGAVPPAIGLVGIWLKADRRPRELKQLLALAEAQARLVPQSESADSIGNLITAIADNATKRENNRAAVNPTNVGLTLVLGALGGVGSYLLFLWAVSSGPLEPLAWVVFSIVVLITLLFVAAGVGTTRNAPAVRKTT